MRCDITGLIAFLMPQRWPEGAALGDLLEIELVRALDFWAHPDRGRFSVATSQALSTFFENGGERLHLFGVCVESASDLTVEATQAGVLAPLMQRLRVEEDIAILISPDIAFLPCSTDHLGRTTSQTEIAWDTLLAHCAEMGNRFFVMDAPRGAHGAELVSLAAGFSERNPSTRSYGALYYPWLRRSESLFPPSGAIAGIYARMERERGDYGVAWPPANIALRGATDLEVNPDWREAGDLSDARINPLIIQAGRGVVVWGARTLSADPNFRAINSRRVVSMVTEQLRRDNEWAVFEQNDAKVWAVLERNARVRLEEFWRAGLITSEAPRGDYLVQCDHETNSPVERNAGTLNVRVQLRPIGMTEHITIDLRLGESGA